MLTVPEVVWAAASDARLDAHIAGFRGHRRVHCSRNPDAYVRECDDEQAAKLACAGCPIVLACREQALRQELGAGESYGVRGGMTARARARQIARRPSSGGRVIYPATLNTEEVLAYLATRGYVIERHTWSSKCSRGTAPKPLMTPGRPRHWDMREVLAWDHTRVAVNQNP